MRGWCFIPSVRELAEQLLVHPNTVARAFQDLERAGVVTPRRGRGMEVTASAPAACRARRQELVRGRIRQALREAAASVLSPEEIRRSCRGRAGRRQRQSTASGETLMETVIETRDLMQTLRRQVRRWITLTLSVPKGAIFALLGDNGAGKTTTIRMLTGLLPADSGSANILGHDCWSAPAAARAGSPMFPNGRASTTG